ncbi:MAG: hypothetical protein M1826_005787 [Phylliscum demangeonii]|nr:MAG: hypothetical protein M1826_005787 [Phylliscum demangeonii]
MTMLKVFLAALAVATPVLAQNGCTATNNTIQNQGDAKALAGCQTISGDLVIAETTAGQIDLSGIQHIQGSLICQGAIYLTGISATSLTTIDHDFRLESLTIMSSLNFPVLSSVGSISWTALPALQELSFTSHVRQTTDVLITNTNLKSLDGINLEKVNKFNVNNNPYLTRIETQLANISEALIIQANSKDLVVSFPNLIWAYNMTFRNCSNVMVPSLSSVNGSMGFFDNSFTTFSAPNLTMTGDKGSLVFVSNQALTNISIPMLKTIGGTYQIANNTNLKVIDGFQQLATVAGAIDFSGNFTNVTLPALQDVRGGFNMQTSRQFDCTPFQAEKQSGVIKGRFICTGSLETPGSVSTNPNPTTTTAASASPTKTGAAAHLPRDLLVVVGLAALSAVHLSL